MSKFNFNIDIEDNKSPLLHSICHSKSLKLSYEDSIFVDLNLPSKTLWSKYNLGVNTDKLNEAIDWVGDYYAWGEIETKDDFTPKTYKFLNGNSKLTKYCIHKQRGRFRHTDDLRTLQLIDDAAYNQNDIMQMPTMYNFSELLKYTTWDFMWNYKEISGLCGMLFKSKNNNETIFFPSLMHKGISSIPEEIGYYWSSTLYSSDSGYAKYLHFNISNKSYIGSSPRYNGYPIKPVKFGYALSKDQRYNEI